MQQLLTRTEVAQTLSVNVRTVDRYIKDGLLAAVQLKGTKLVRIRREDLDAFLVERPKEPPPQPILST